MQLSHTRLPRSPAASTWRQGLGLVSTIAATGVSFEWHLNTLLPMALAFPLTFWGARLFVRHPQAASACCYLFDVHLLHSASETSRMACSCPTLSSRCNQQAILCAIEDIICRGIEADHCRCNRACPQDTEDFVAVLSKAGNCWHQQSQSVPWFSKSPAPTRLYIRPHIKHAATKTKQNG